MVFGVNDEAHLYNTPTNFTVLAQPTTQLTDAGTGVFYRFATSADVAGSTTYTLTENAGTGVQCNIAACIRYTGVDSSQFPLTFNNSTPTTANPVSARVGITHNTATVAANAQCQAPTNPTTIGASDMVFRAYMTGDDAAATGKTVQAAPAGWTQRGSYVSNVTSKFNVAMVICDQLGATNSSTISTNHISMWDVYTISIPAVLAAPPQPIRSLQPLASRMRAYNW